MAGLPLPQSGRHTIEEEDEVAGLFPGHGVGGMGPSGNSQNLELQVTRLTQQMATLMRPIGRGDYQAPANTVVERSMITMDRRISDLEGCMYTSWGFALDDPYITTGKTYLTTYNQRCQAVKGQNIRLGPASNWVMLGLLQAYCTDAAEEENNKIIMNKLIQDTIGKGNGELDHEKIPLLYKIASHAQIKISKKQAFLIMCFRKEYECVEKAMNTAWQRTAQILDDPQGNTPPCATLGIT